MTIGIDISQLAYRNTGVANYLLRLLKELVHQDNNTYVLFFSSLRRDIDLQELGLDRENVILKKFKLPPVILDTLWNKMHIMPIENFIGNIDLFLTSDWTEPPVKKAKKATIIYDMIVYKHPEETNERIVKTQKRKLKWVKKESDIIFCISKSTKNDAIQILNLDKNKVRVIYPGVV